MTPLARWKVRRLANALTAEDLRDLAIELKFHQAASRQLPGIVDLLVDEHHEAPLARIELRIKEAAKEAAGA